MSKETAYTLAMSLAPTLLFAYHFDARKKPEKNEWALLQATECTYRYPTSEKYKTIDKSDSNKHSDWEKIVSSSADIMAAYL